MKSILFICGLFILSSAAEPLKAKNDIQSVFTLSILEAPSVYHVGSYLSFKLSFTNNTNEPQSFTYYKPNFWYPAVKESTTDKVIEITGEIYDGPVKSVTRDVGPGETVIVDTWPVHILAQPTTDMNESKLICNPGKYKMFFKITVTHNNQDITLVSDTKEITIEP